MGASIGQKVQIRLRKYIENSIDFQRTILINKKNPQTQTRIIKNRQEHQKILKWFCAAFIPFSVFAAIKKKNMLFLTPAFSLSLLLIYQHYMPHIDIMQISMMGSDQFRKQPLIKVQSHPNPDSQSSNQQENTKIFQFEQKII